MTDTTFPPPPASPPPPARKRVRSLFWPGFVLGFALLGLASCGGLAVALGLTDLSLAELQGVGAAWTPPTLIPTVEPEEVNASAVQNGGGTFQAGDQVRIVAASNVRVRTSPGYLGKPADDVLMQVAPGTTLEIVGELASQDNLTWWLVRVNGIEGWIAEATASGVQILAKYTDAPH